MRCIRAARAMRRWPGDGAKLTVKLMHAALAQFGQGASFGSWASG